jgi:DNA invertase Pin-like site-specific DNA recombinase
MKLYIGTTKKIFDRQEVLDLRNHGQSLRKIARNLGINLGTVSRTLTVLKSVKKEADKEQRLL